MMVQNLSLRAFVTTCVGALSKVQRSGVVTVALDEVVHGANMVAVVVVAVEVAAVEDVVDVAVEAVAAMATTLGPLTTSAKGQTRTTPATTAVHPTIGNGIVLNPRITAAQPPSLPV